MTVQDLNPHNYPTTPAQAENLSKLAAVISQIEYEMKRTFKVNSGLRSQEDQMRINPSVKNSAHMYGEAVDLNDPDGSIYGWCLDNVDLLIHWGLYIESKTFTPRWIHAQIRPTHNRFFIP